jgi:hypothetical protein
VSGVFERIAVDQASVGLEWLEGSVTGSSALQRVAVEVVAEARRRLSSAA